jgi:hypothetical protein
MASWSFATTSRGVFAGATTACHDVTTMSGNPASAIVGTSGRLGWRVCAVTASAFMRLPLM